MIEIEGKEENSTQLRFEREHKREKNTYDSNTRKWKKTVMNCREKPYRELKGHTREGRVE